MKTLSILAGLPWLLSTARAQPCPFEPCPIRCSKAGPNPSGWTYLHGKVALTRCPKATLFDLAIYTSDKDQDSLVTFRACTSEDASDVQAADHKSTPLIFGEPKEQWRAEETSFAHGCLAGAKTYRSTTNAQLLAWDITENQLASRTDSVAAAERLNSWLENDADCRSSIMFARAGQAVIGLYVGDEIHKPSASGVIKRFIDTLKRDVTSSSGQVAAQLCWEKVPRTRSMGIFADLSGNNISAAQEAVRNWHSAECLKGADSTDIWETLEIEMVKAADVPVNHERSGGFKQKSERLKERSSTHDLVTRADCKAIKAVAGDGCYSLADRCGISQDKLKSFNSKTDKLCDIGTLQAGQWVCCSKGNLPDRAFPNADTPDAKQSKAALAHLCRASKQCARIAQPILYHSYATGNLPSQQDLGLPDDHHNLCTEDDKLPAFLRTVIDRPDLAQLVLTMQLVGSDNTSGCTDKLVQVFERASDQVGMDYPPKEFWLQDVLGSREDYLEEQGDLHPGRCTIHNWLEELCILLTPNVTTLLLARNQPGPFDRLIEAYNNGRSGSLLPSLRTLALRSLSSVEWRPENPRGLFKSAPNLQTFYCMQAAVTDAYLERFTSSYGGLLLFERIRTLVLSNPDDGDLMDILFALPALEEIECLCTGRDFPTFPGYGTLLRGCRNRKGTPLRRLRCGWAPNNYDAEYTAPEHYELAFDEDRYSTVWPEELLPLDHLEELTIDQAAFHYAGYVRPDVEEDDDESDSGNRRLVDILPRSLRDLHLIYVYRDMTADLVELAMQCLAGTFAHLRTVRISLTERPNPERIPGLERMRNAVDVAFVDGPVRILWGPTSMIGGDPMMVVPGGTAGAKLIEPPTLIHHLPDGGAGYNFDRTMRERTRRIKVMQ